MACSDLSISVEYENRKFATVSGTSPPPPPTEKNFVCIPYSYPRVTLAQRSLSLVHPLPSQLASGVPWLACDPTCTDTDQHSACLHSAYQESLHHKFNYQLVICTCRSLAAQTQNSCKLATKIRPYTNDSLQCDAVRIINVRWYRTDTRAHIQPLTSSS